MAPKGEMRFIARLVIVERMEAAVNGVYCRVNVSFGSISLLQ
jgi:hypothetical protein